MPAVACVVPARMGSSRFPGKPLVLIRGRPMIVRTLEQARRAGCFSRIICATDHEDIRAVVENAGFECVITPPCQTGSDRVAWVASLLSLPLVVNLQGDEPVVDPQLCVLVAEKLVEEPDSWITAASPLDPAWRENPHRVKVLIENGYARAFSRQAVGGDGSPWFLHQGIYGYSLESLRQFIDAGPSAEETRHSIEPLRIMGMRRIRVVMAKRESLSVDTLQDLARVESYLQRIES